MHKNSNSTPNLKIFQSSEENNKNSSNGLRSSRFQPSISKFNHNLRQICHSIIENDGTSRHFNQKTLYNIVRENREVNHLRARS